MTLTDRINAAIAENEAQLAAFPNDEDLERELIELRQKRETLLLRIQTIRTGTSTLNELEPQIAAEIIWRDQLVVWRKTLDHELFAFPDRIYDAKELGRKQNVQLSLRATETGSFAAGTGWCLETLRLGQLMRDAGYVEGPKAENQAFGRLPWFGSLHEVQRRIVDLQNRQQSAQTALDDALLDDAARTAKAEAEAAQRAAVAAAPKRMTRADGSQYDRYPDGHVVEVEPAPQEPEPVMTT